MEFVQVVQVLFAGCAVLVALLGVYMVGLRFVIAPVVAVGAIPTYAAMVGIEYFVLHHFKNGCLRSLSVERPSTFWKKLWMDVCATFSTLCGMFIVMLIFTRMPSELAVQRAAAKFIFRDSQESMFLLVVVFWISFLCVYGISKWFPDVESHPMNKLEKLAVPDWLGKFFQRGK